MAFECFAPLIDVEADDPEAIGGLQLFGINCALRCTGTQVNSDEVDSYYALQTILAGVSLALALLCNITWGIFSVKAKQKMTFWVTFTSVCVTSFTFFPLLFAGNGEETWCLDDHTPRRQSDGISGCVLQGMAVIFFGLALCCWWWCSCFDLFTKLYRRKKNIEGYLTYYHIFSWGLPGICTSIILFSGNFGYEQPRLWCFLSPEAPPAFQFVFFYGWIGLLWLTGTIMFGLTLYSIFAGGNKGAGKSSTMKKLSIYRVPLVFVLIFSMFWAVFFGFVLITEAQRDDLTASGESWVECLNAEVLLQVQAAVAAALANNDDPPAFEDLNIVIGSPDPQNLASEQAVAQLDPPPEGGIENRGCGTVQPGRLSPGLLHIAVISLAGNGSLMFLIFGLQKQNYVLWKRYISSGFDPKSVKPKRRQGRKVTERQYSTYQQLRIGIAKFTIYCCEKFAGIDGGGRQPGGPKRPILTQDNSDYEPKLLDNRTEFNTGARDVDDRETASNFPRVSYKPQAGVVRAGSKEDPFPGPGSHQTVGESILNRSPPPRGAGNDLNQFYSSRQQQHHSTAEWSDVYDELWGNEVEF